jgi:2-keto-4-pentenoate hydratase/2-oxohepta-3-ene-1,7-dioic acid hydratase in catechol pathway
VTKDEVPDPQNLPMWLTVNGKTMQDGSTKTMVYGVPILVSYLSQFMTLHPGDIISTGTPPGVGIGMKPPQLPEGRRRGRARHRGLGTKPPAPPRRWWTAWPNWSSAVTRCTSTRSGWR